MRAVQLHAVEPRLLCADSGGNEFRNDRLHFCGGHLVRLLLAYAAGLGAGRPQRLVAVDIHKRLSAGMMQLGKYLHILRVQRFHSSCHRRDLLIPRKARLLRSCDAVLVVHAGIFQHDHADAALGPLHEVGHEILPDALLFIGNAHGERAHHDAVFDGQVTNFAWRK